MSVTLPVDYVLDDVDIFDSHGVNLPCKGGTVTIGQLSPYDWFYIYMPAMQRIIKYFDTILPSIDLTSDNRKESVNVYGQALYTAFLTRQFRNYFLAILKKLGIIQGRIKKFEREMVTMNQLAEIFTLLYKFNTEGFKKKTIFLAESIYAGKTSATSSTHVRSGAGSRQPINIVDRIELPR